MSGSVALLGPFCAFFSSVTWAVGSSAYSRLSRGHSAFGLSFTRAAIALPLFVALSFASARGWHAGWARIGALTASQLGWCVLSMVASYGLGDVVFLVSTRSIGISGALALASSYPLWVALAGWWWNGEALRALQCVGLLAAVGGIAVVILYAPGYVPPATDGHRATTARSGVALALLASLFWATNGYAVAHVGKEVSAALGCAIRMGMALVLCAALHRAFAGSGRLLLPWRETRRWAWVFVLESFVGSLSFMYGLSHSPLALGSTLSALAPVLSVPVALALGIEKFSMGRTSGVCLVVAGLSLLTMA